MRRILISWLFLFFTFTFWVGCDQIPKSKEEKKEIQTADKDQSTNSQIYVRSWVDNLNIRSEPSLDAAVLAQLSQNESAIYLQEYIEKDITVNLKGKELFGYFLKIKNKNGIIGWVHSAGLSLMTTQTSQILKAGDRILHLESVLDKDKKEDDPASGSIQGIFIGMEDYQDDFKKFYFKRFDFYEMVFLIETKEDLSSKLGSVVTVKWSEQVVSIEGESIKAVFVDDFEFMD